LPSRPDDRQGVIARLVWTALNNSVFQQWGGHSVKDYLHSEDFTEALARIIQRRLTGILNVASGVATSLDDLVQMVEVASGRNLQVEVQPAPDWDVQETFSTSASPNRLPVGSPRSTSKRAWPGKWHGCRPKAIRFLARESLQHPGVGGEFLSDLHQTGSGSRAVRNLRKAPLCDRVHGMAAIPRIVTREEVMFFDTDCGGVVHNIAYLRMIETARTKLAGRMGMGSRDMAERKSSPSSSAPKSITASPQSSGTN